MEKEMAGTQIVIDVSGLDRKMVNGWLFFCRSALRNVGLSMEVYNEPELGEDKLLVCVDGPLEAFTHRLIPIAQYGAIFGGAIAEITGSSDLRYSKNIFVKILKECQELVNEHAEVVSALQSEGRVIEVFVASLPPKLEAIRTELNHPDYLKVVVEELSIAIKLLHDKPYDPTLALIAADRSAEIFLKGRLQVSNKKFPELLTQALNNGLLSSSQISNLENAHRARNKCQHEGVDIDFYEAVQHVKAIIEAITHGVT